MNAQLNHILARQRTAELQHAGEQARLAREVRMRGRKLRHRNLITRLRARPARVLGSLIVAVMLAVLALSAPAATADPVGQITDFSTGLNQASVPVMDRGGAGRQPVVHRRRSTRAIGRITPCGADHRVLDRPEPAQRTRTGSRRAGRQHVVHRRRRHAARSGGSRRRGRSPSSATGLNPVSGPTRSRRARTGTCGSPTRRRRRARSGGSPRRGRSPSTPAGLDPGSVPGRDRARAPTATCGSPTTGTTNAIGRITPSGQITEYSAGLNPGSDPDGIAAGARRQPVVHGRGDHRDRADHSVRADHRVHEPAEAIPGPRPDRGGARRQPVVHRATGHARDRPDHHVGADHRVATGSNQSTYPVGITAGQDGDLWFADAEGAIGRIGSGALPALDAPASIAGQQQQTTFEIRR